MIQVVRVGYDETLGGFTYLSFAPKNSPTIEFGQITPDTVLTPVFTPFNLVGFESIYEIDKDAELEKIVSFKMLVNTCEESDRLQIIDEYLSLTYPEGSYDTEPIDIKNDVEEDPDDEEE